MNWKEHDHHQQFKQHTGSFPAPHRAPQAPCPVSPRGAGPHTPAAGRLARGGADVSPGWGREGAEEGMGGRGLPPKDRRSRRRRRLRAELSSRLRLHRGRPVGDSRHPPRAHRPRRRSTPRPARGRRQPWGMPGSLLRPAPARLEASRALRPASPAPAVAARSRAGSRDTVPHHARRGSRRDQLLSWPPVRAPLPPTDRGSSPRPRGVGSPRLTSAGRAPVRGGRQGTAHTRLCRGPSVFQTHRVRLEGKPATCR